MQEQQLFSPHVHTGRADYGVIAFDADTSVLPNAWKFNLR